MTWSVLSVQDTRTELVTQHVVPQDDLRPHQSDACWCHPATNEDGTVVHNSLDGRESHEQGRRLQ
jgi:hypothetical protein